MNVNANILEINEVDRSFRVGFWLKRVQVLQNITFSVKRNSVFGLLGHNGAGKTTLIQLVAGIRPPNRGSVKIDGSPASTPTARKVLGYTPERPYFHEHLTGEQLLYYMGTLSGLTRDQIAARIPEVLATVNMEHGRHKELRAYSKGMLQRIGIAQAILPDPQLLVFDEPMSGLDPIGRREIRDLILGLGKQGRTVFFSTHLIEDVESICQEIAVLQKGKLVGYGPSGEFMTPDKTAVEIGFSAKRLDPNFDHRFPGASLEKIPEGWKLTCMGSDNLNPLLKSMIDQELKVMWVRPLRPSLEEMFRR
ncbi:MAG: ABC transporter ATP-binding protein [Bacteriovoracia bacterium]